MDPLVVALLGLVTAVLSGAGVWSFLERRRASSGKVATTEAADLWAATKAYQEEMGSELKIIKVELAQLAKDYREEARLRMDEVRKRIECEARVLKLETESDAANILRSAHAAADVIRAEAAIARSVIKDTATVAAQELKDERNGG